MRRVRPILFVGVVADLVAVFVHGVLGHRAVIAPLRGAPLFSTAAFGDADMTRRILAVAFHVVTAALACSSAAFAILAMGIIADPTWARWLGTLHVVFLVVGLSLVGVRLTGALRRPIPAVFSAVMVAGAAAGWLGAR
jgi:hypothetical protein